MSGMECVYFYQILKRDKKRIRGITMNIELAYQLLVCAGKRNIINEYGKEMYVAIKKISDAKLKEILPKIPKLKNSHFDFKPRSG
jgi:hypothetical protein